MRRIRVAVVLVSALFVFAGGTVGARGTAAVPAQAGPHLYIVLLPGLCAWPHSDPYCSGHVSAANRARATFRQLLAALSSERVSFRSLYYSYSVGHSASYSINETHQSVARSVDALELQLRGLVKRDPSASFVLVGHSLGGVIAASWAVSNGRSYGLTPARGLLTRVQSIITYDSPLRGLHGVLTANLAARVFGGAVWYSLQPDGETIKEITFFPDSWWRRAAHLHSIANSADRIVAASESQLGDSRVVRDTSCSTDLLFLQSCHGATLEDAPLNTWVVCHWIPGPSACRPIPTPTRTPTPPAPTVTPTSPSTTPTEGPLPTATRSL